MFFFLFLPLPRSNLFFCGSEVHIARHRVPNGLFTAAETKLQFLSFVSPSRVLYLFRETSQAKAFPAISPLPPSRHHFSFITKNTQPLKFSYDVFLCTVLDFVALCRLACFFFLLAYISPTSLLHRSYIAPLIFVFTSARFEISWFSYVYASTNVIFVSYSFLCRVFSASLFMEMVGRQSSSGSLTSGSFFFPSYYRRLLATSKEDVQYRTI